ncbi:GNAT family N-acetyltransferase [Microlunatus speluncae]|uniref:GNAT family N-acetyltransferase n=1 Tax=Microlunatus speluncae TaxID=2594267 RepID=UPI00126653F7|nr:GNAT family N-acetyltransferase [Microlunatus speluncae]
MADRPEDHPAGGAGFEPITFRLVTEADFPLLARWLSRAHVARWWNHDFSAEGVARDFGPAARGEEPSEDFLALLDGVPFGLIQRSRFDDYPDYRAEVAAHIEVPPGTVTIDYLIGEGGMIGRGVGTRMVLALVERTWIDHPDAPAIIVPVAAGNIGSWRALEKAGLVRIASADLVPDNPIDPPLHHLHRIDRPI